MRSYAKRVVTRTFWITTLLFGVVLLFGSFSPVSADTIGIAVGSVGSSIAVGSTAPDGSPSRNV